MTATSKAFAYAFNTPSEDHQVARVLSGRDPEQEVHVLSLETFDSTTQSKIHTIAAALFNASYGLKASQYNVNGTVIDMLMAYLLCHYPSLKKLNENGLPVKRLEACTIQQGHFINELVAWSSHLLCNTSTKRQTGSTKTHEATADITKHPVFLQAAMIEQLVQINGTLVSRVGTLEDVVFNKTPQTASGRSEDPINEPPAKRRRTSAATNLSDVWFTWSAHEPRIWSSKDTATKHTRSTSKQVAAFLKLFLPEWFFLDQKSPQYRDDVLELGATAEKELLLFLSEHKIKARGAQNVLNSMRELHKAGHHSARIRQYKQLQAAGRVVDPAPADTINSVGLTSST